MERETGVEPATSSLGIQTYVGSKSLARFCGEFLNLQRFAESAFSEFSAQLRHKRDIALNNYGRCRGAVLRPQDRMRRTVRGGEKMPGAPALFFTCSLQAAQMERT